MKNKHLNIALFALVFIVILGFLIRFLLVPFFLNNFSIILGIAFGFLLIDTLLLFLFTYLRILPLDAVALNFPLILIFFEIIILSKNKIYILIILMIFTILLTIPLKIIISRYRFKKIQKLNKNNKR